MPRKGVGAGLVGLALCGACIQTHLAVDARASKEPCDDSRQELN